MTQMAAQFRNEDLLKLRNIAASLDHAAPLYAALGKHLERDTRDHFRMKEGHGNKKGWPSKQFWIREGVDKTALSHYDDNGAVVGIASAAIAHKVTGGTITPKRGKALAIPVDEKAYLIGSPREWDDSDGVLFRPKGKNWLGTADDAGLHVMYVLVASVTQDADPDALPDMAAEGRRIVTVAHSWLARQIAKG